ncbi:MAG: NAD(P)/FAD-dependent oxidoreductase [Halodesulfurarchaeum sp.]
MDEVDVAIVGGGPAGTAAARSAALEGAATVVLEKGVPREDREDRGPDSTDAAGFLDYWVDIAGLDIDSLPDHVIHRPLAGATFFGPNENVTISKTGIEASYPHFGFTFDRVAFDDWHREQAEEAGADYRVGQAVRSVEKLERNGHRLILSSGEEIKTRALILGDGPQRRVTIPVLDSYLSGEQLASSVLSPPEANHIAYQEYRRIPSQAIDQDRIAFWWGWLPGHTAYPWIFPIDGEIAKVGLTMPIGTSLSSLEDPSRYPLLSSEDASMPSPRDFLRRFLERRFPEYDIESDLPLVTDCGKDEGTETYPISSTRPIDSPTAYNVAVIGGAMGATSAFHEGGDHVALRTGQIAGRLAAVDALDQYNTAWKAAIGSEIRRNVALAEMVRGYEPADWDQVLGIGTRMLKNQSGAKPGIGSALSAGIPALKLFMAYRYRKYRLRSDRLVQIPETAYTR